MVPLISSFILAHGRERCPQCFHCGVSLIRDMVKHTINFDMAAPVPSLIHFIHSADLKVEPAAAESRQENLPSESVHVESRLALTPTAITIVLEPAEVL